ncbi:MAG: hypothetical protein IJZ87_07750 [Bacteroidales bacterium]|nr:hypothetical protein [Bacteroidales bacterium]
MKKSLLFLLLLMSFVVKAQTYEVSGNQEGTWDCDTVLVVGDVVVPEENSLIIAEGTKVIFQDYYSILVEGSFSALGCEDDSIYFTVADTTGFYIWNSGQGGWNALTIQGAETPVTIEYCNFSYGKAAENMTRGGALRIYDTEDVNINNCTFFHNFTREKGGALYAENSNLKITNCEIDNNLGYCEDGSYMHGAGFQFLNCSVNMEDMYFHDNYCSSCYGGGVNFDSCNVVVNKAIFEDNYAVNAGGVGIQRSNDFEVRISNVLLNNNIAYHYGGAMAMATSSPLIQNVTMVNNYTIAAGGGAMQFFSEARPVFKNCIIWGNDWYESQDTFDDASQIFVWGSDCAPEFYYSVLEGGLKQIHGNQYVAVYDHQTMVETDPLFVDTVNRDFQLLPESPAINRGTIDTTGLSIPPIDLAGNQRIIDDRIDMGCYESNVTSLKDIYSSNKNVNIYPNPINANSVCEFLLRNESNVNVKIFNQKASLISVKNYGKMKPGMNEIPMSDFIVSLQKNNVYLLSIESEEETINIKFIY